jgi:hypothetical protein
VALIEGSSPERPKKLKGRVERHFAYLFPEIHVALMENGCMGKFKENRAEQQELNLGNVLKRRHPASLISSKAQGRYRATPIGFQIALPPCISGRCM